MSKTNKSRIASKKNKKDKPNFQTSFPWATKLIQSTSVPEFKEGKPEIIHENIPFILKKNIGRYGYLYKGRVPTSKITDMLATYTYLYFVIHKYEIIEFTYLIKKPENGYNEYFFSFYVPEIDSTYIVKSYYEEELEQTLNSMKRLINYSKLWRNIIKNDVAPNV